MRPLPTHYGGLARPLPAKGAREGGSGTWPRRGAPAASSNGRSQGRAGRIARRPALNGRVRMPSSAMRRSDHRLACALLFALCATSARATPNPSTTPTAILAEAPAADWATIPLGELLVVELQGGGRVVVALAGDFAPVHLANIRTLAQAHWYDGLAVERVQDGYVTQWGDPDGKKALPGAVVRSPPAEYERPATGLSFTPLPYHDTYAAAVGASGPFPVAQGDGRAWPTHCYGMVGVGRDMNPDTGTGAELYAVIGQPIRALDRNIAVVGRVVSGMENLSALPRGSGDMGFYNEARQRAPIRWVRLAIDLPSGEQPHLQYLKPDSGSYTTWVHARANRQDSFFLRPAGAVDICSVMPPVRTAP
jgi:peptidylprolyl isomerase